jgi:putative acetyltransferase
MQIIVDDLTSPQVAALLQEHLQSAAQHSPPESVHALNLDGLRQPDITVWSAWEGDDLVGCGALKELDARHGEIKSMRVASNHLRKGYASRILQHILDEASRRSYEVVSLETGSMEAFAPARKLYTRFGFQECGPFGEYVEDPYSTFMTLEL